MASTQDSTCQLGTEKLTPIQITADTNSAAALLVDTAANLYSNQSSFFIFIDPTYVKNFVLTLKAPMLFSNVTQQRTSLCEAVTCTLNHLKKVDTLVIKVSPLISVSDAIPSEKTIIDLKLINNIYFDAKNNTQIFLKKVIYLLSETTNVEIKDTSIRQQTFVFLNKQELQIKNNKIISEQGFECSLYSAKNILLDFSSEIRIFGFYSPSSKQSVSINAFTGIDSQKIAIFSGIVCENFTVRLLSNSQFINKNIIILLGNYESDLSLVVFKEKESPTLFKLGIPIDNLEIMNSSMSEVFITSFKRIENYYFQNFTTNPYYKISVRTEEDLKIKLHGSYQIKSNTYPSKIILVKNLNQVIKCNLEINMGNISYLSIEDLNVLKLHKFDKVSAYSYDELSNNITHYYFNEHIKLPEINGMFTYYEIIKNHAHWIIILKNKDSNEVTQVWLSQNNKEILIHNILYKIDFLYLKLYAITNNKVTSINAKHLLAPIKINKRLKEIITNYDNNSLIVEDFEVIDANSHTLIQLQNASAPLPILFFKSKSKLASISQPSPISKPPASYEHNVLLLTHQNSPTLRDRLSEKGYISSSLSYLKTAAISFFSSAAIIVTGSIGGLLLWNKFKRQEPVRMAETVTLLATTTVSLLPQTESIKLSEVISELDVFKFGKMLHQEVEKMKENSLGYSQFSINNFFKTEKQRTKESPKINSRISMDHLADNITWSNSQLNDALVIANFFVRFNCRRR